MGEMMSSTTSIPFLKAGPTLLATALKSVTTDAGTPAYTSGEIASALHSPGVYGGLSASELAQVLYAPSLYPGFSRGEMADALIATGIDARAARDAVDAALGGPPLLKLVEARASSELPALYNRKPQTADRLIEGPNAGGTFWNSSLDGSDPSPWFWIKLEQTSIVRMLTIRWKAKDGHVGARAMKYDVMSSIDGITWSATGLDQSTMPGLSPERGTDVLPGWASPTRFIKVSMSESSYAPPRAYFTCHYVLVAGEPV
ncbi:discoidin domain-containing protein [Stigmatella sp. ncwal1]|uniref:Discoidin domain-containing protein n=1 Tax=Stigmatella ashevillensis TaxID=2995309 RepID=A0ABT5D599_9BACT|nr:discoidin domain-containing protein [Stigmatella ashevillena]MDC0708741.1 discoidin domain-containing protein [Stigmatella ashevillena]